MDRLLVLETSYITTVQQHTVKKTTQMQLVYGLRHFTNKMAMCLYV